MSPNIFSRHICWKWRFLRRVKDGLKNTDQEAGSSTALPLYIDLNDGQAGLQDQVKPEDCETTPTISHFALLPFELCQAIIDNLSDDQTALHACSLTCKAFLHPSRRHIFHSITLNHKEDATHFLCRICFTDSPTSLCTYVRTLSVYQGKFWRPQFLDETLPFLATFLPNVTSLTLGVLDWTSLDDSRREKILSGFPNVQYLALQASFETSQQANEFISSFPFLTTLHLWEMNWQSYSEPVIPLPCGLKSITMPSNTSHFLNRLLHLKSPGVSALCFKDFYSEDAQAVGELLKTLGSRLEHLQLIERYGTLTTAVRVNLINLSHNINLRSVRLFLWSTRPDNVSALDWMYTLFSQITSHHVEDVSLELPVDDVVSLEAFLPSIERVFTQHHWSNLRRLQITNFKGTMRETPQPIEVYMPILDSQGVILVTNW